MLIAKLIWLALLFKNCFHHSVHFSCSVMSNSLRYHGLLHTRFHVHHRFSELTQSPRPLSRWWHSTFSSSVVPFCSHLQSSPASGSFPMSQFFTSGDQSSGVSASTLVLPMNIQDCFPSGLVESPCSPRDSQESSPTPQLKASILRRSAFFTVQRSQPYMITGQTIALTRWTLIGKVMSLLFSNVI